MYCWWEGKLVQSLCNIVWRHLKNVKIKLPYGQAILRPNIYPKKMKTLTVKDICDALFTIAKIWKQHKCPSIDEWIIKSRYTHTHTHTHTDTHTHRWGDTIQPQKKMKSCHLQQYQRTPRALCFK